MTAGHAARPARSAGPRAAVRRQRPRSCSSRAAFAAPTIELWTEGACSGNPGLGGWAAILVARAPDGTVTNQVQLSGGDPRRRTTAWSCRRSPSGLQAPERPAGLTVHIDSSYVMDAIVKGWHVGWVKRGWRTATKQPVKNRELCEQLLALVERHTITWHKVKGHAGVALTERCHELAVAACQTARRAA